MTNGDQRHLFGGTWTEEKLKILAAYLNRYNIALKNQPFTRVYIDAFAGTGYRRKVQQKMARLDILDIFREIHNAETQEFLKGSAKLALEVEPSFHEYVFVESDPAKVTELESLRIQHPDKAAAIEIVQNDANEYVQEYCKRMSELQRAVVFLDPFATQVAWATVEAIAKTHAMDTWILFPLMAVNRLLAQDHRKACRGALDRIFGTPDWFERFYRKRSVNDIFGQSLEVVRKACDSRGISDFYLERLRGVFVDVAPHPRLLKNSRNAPLFLLFFAAGNEKGARIAVRIAKHLLEKL